MEPAQTEYTSEQIQEMELELFRQSCRSSFYSFFTAYPPAKDYVYGKHTLGLIEELQKTRDEYLNKDKCRFLAVCMPFRHGKSDVVSRRFPVWNLINNPDDEIILTSYNSDLSNELSYDARSLMRDIGNDFGVGISKDRSGVSHWRMFGHKGGVNAAGLQGTIIGKGAKILIIDDYLKGRESAESQLQRDKVWDTFQNELMTRLTPVHAVIIVANRWHEDDLVGRIENINDPLSVDYDKDFPDFEIIKYPAQDDNGEWLFPERFPEQWYKRMKATLIAGGLSQYAWSALAQQNPKPRIGNMLRADLCQIVDEFPKGLLYQRGWDLASTEKAIGKPDPDYTAGVKSAVTFDETEAPTIYVSDIIHGQWQKPERDRRILGAADDDGSEVKVWVEAVAGYKDAYIDYRTLLRGKSVVRQFIAPGDKVVKAGIVEAAFEAGRVILKRGPWNQKFIDECKSFPSGKHDDMVDGLVISCYNLMKRKGRAGISG